MYLASNALLWRDLVITPFGRSHLRSDKCLQNTDTDSTIGTIQVWRILDEEEGVQKNRDDLFWPSRRIWRFSEFLVHNGQGDCVAC